jgi:hypothetical protein
MSKGEHLATALTLGSSPVDVQQIDNWLAQNWNSYLQRLASVFGTVFLVTYSFPWLAFMFIPIVGYFVRSSNQSDVMIPDQAVSDGGLLYSNESRDQES